MEIRNFRISELRVTEGKQPKIIGSIPYNSESEDMGFIEVLKPGCFARAISEGGKILSLWNHDTGKPLANTAKGTLVLRDSDDALNIEIKPDTTISWANDAVQAVRRGDCSGFSFGFRMSYDGSGERWVGNTREIIEVKELFEVSPCTMPAYSESQANVRKQGDKKLKKYKEKQDLIDNVYLRMEELYSLPERDERSLTASENIELNKLSNTWDQHCERFDLDSTREIGVGGLIAEMRKPLFEPEKIDPNPNKNSAGEDRSKAKGYELRSPGDKKDFRSLYGQISINDYRWTDKDSTFFRALFSGRFHPDLTKRAMSEGVPSDGGFLVPTEHTEKIHNVSLENEIIAPRAFVQPMKSNEIEIPAMEIGDHSSSLFGGFTASYKPEAGTLSEANPKTRGMTLNAKKLTGFLRFSNELLSDAPNGEKQILNICGKGLAWYRDKAFLKGSGAGEPLGILNAGCLLEQAKESGQAASTIVYQNLTGMMAKMHGGCFLNSVWICHQTTIPQLLELSIPIGTGGAHIPVMKESNGAFSMLTRPVIFTEKTEPLGSKGDIVLADLSQYVIGLREEMRIDLSQHVYFTTDEAAARLIERHDAQPLWSEALTLEDSSTQVSPFVTLAERS